MAWSETRVDLLFTFTFTFAFTFLSLSRWCTGRMDKLESVLHTPILTCGVGGFATGIVGFNARFFLGFGFG